MSVGANRFDLALHGNQTIRRADEALVQTLHHRLHTPILPKIAVPPPGTEIRQS